jgi:hypothetical protein
MSTPEERYEQSIKEIYEPIIARTFKILDEMGIIEEILFDQMLYGDSIRDAKEMEAAVEDACNERFILQAAATPKPVMLDCWRRP